MMDKMHAPPFMHLPPVGDLTRLGLLGSDTVGQEALIRFYVLHVAILPVIITVFIIYHMWRIRKDGGISSPKESPE
jgi:quinol-cytochrome oxidoreductase complex cytochrome b subunit